MKKRTLLSIALLSAVVAAGSSNPLTSYAAEENSARDLTVKCYKVYIGQGSESLSQAFKDLCNTINNIGNLCPGQGNPGVETPSPEAPNPETPAPEAPTPETPKPETPAPETPKPETPAPEAPKPETPAPETPKPETPAPEAPKPPVEEDEDSQKPDNGESGETALSYARQIVKLVNEERAKAGLPALQLDADITAAANVRAKEITQKFSHTRPNGSSFSSVLKEQGVSFRGSGENIAWGQKSPEQVMNGWMNSDGHRANILNKNFKNIGVGHYQDENGVNYWVQLFTY